MAELGNVSYESDNLESDIGHLCRPGKGQTQGGVIDLVEPGRLPSPPRLRQNSPEAAGAEAGPTQTPPAL